MSKDNGKENFMYLPPPLEMRQNLMQDETASEKFARKIKEHPLVPIGNHLILNWMILTVFCMFVCMRACIEWI